MKDSILPIGSIVSVKNVDIMIIAYLDKNKKIDGDSYDYVCCVYPIGLEENTILVKKEDIENIKFIGYQDVRFSKLKELLEKQVVNNGK